jgi:hypothetical protein
VNNVAKRAWEVSPELTFTLALMLLGGLASMAGVFLDSRVLLGAPVWLKPMKFFFSFMALTGTEIFFLAYLRNRRWARGLGAILSTAAVLEMAVTSVQAARGTMSHFNATTPADVYAFKLMGQMVAVILLVMIATAILLLRQKIDDPVVASGIRGALAVSIVGLAVTGTLMILPLNAEAQRAAAAAYGITALGGGHTFGAGDGGPGLPVVGWSTVAGDMRPAHFLALHAIQALPLVAFWISRNMRVVESAVRVVRAAAAAYLGLILALAAQALRGQSLVRPDLLSLGAFVLAVGVPALFATQPVQTAERVQ